MESILKSKFGFKKVIENTDIIARGKAVKAIPQNLSRLMDGISGACMVMIMLLVVGNILLRSIFKSPILGTYELVGLISAVLVGLAVPFCAFKSCHISVSFFTDKLPKKVENLIEGVTNIISLIFWSFVSYHMFILGYRNFINGVVSSTTQTPIFYFVYVIGLGLVVLSLVLLTKSFESFKKVVIEK